MFSTQVEVFKMNPRSLEFYHAAIKNAYPDAACIRQPEIIGMVAPVFLADVLNRTVVCRFSAPQIIFKNKIVSDLFRDYDIPAPQTRVHAYVGSWFEAYDYCTDKTLYEHMQSGLPDDKIFDAYTSVFKIQDKISRIPTYEFLPKDFRYHVQMLNATSPRRDMLSKLYADFVYSRSARGVQRLLHNDIHSKNILYSPETGCARLIDLDAVSLCNENFTMLMTVQRYPLKNVRQLMSAYQDITGRSLDINKILFACNMMQVLHVLRHPIKAWQEQNRQK